MTNDSIGTTGFQPGAAADERLFDSWFDPIEHAVRDRVRSFIEELIEGELASVLARPRYGRRAKDSGCVETSAGVAGHRHGSRTRTLTGTFGRTEIAVPRARLMQPDGGTTEWKSQALRAYQRRTRAAEALIAGACLAGVNTRRVRRALAALFGGAVGKDVVSRTWRKVKGDAWNARSLADEPIVRLILDGTVVRVRLDRQATAISLLVVIGVRADGQKVLLAVRSMRGESAEAWRAVLDDLIKRGLRRPEFLIVDGAAGLDAAIAAVWDGVPVLLLDLVGIDREVLVADRLQVAPKAGVADQRLVALDKLPLQRGDDRGPVGGILLRLLMVAADDVAPSRQRHGLGLVVDLFTALPHRQRDERRRIVEHQLAHQLVGALPHAQDIQEPPRRQLGHGLGTDHAAVGDHAHASNVEASAQPVDHGDQRRHVAEHRGMLQSATGSHRMSR